MTDIKAPQQFEHQITAAESGKRIDQVAAQAFDQFSRARIQRWIRDGNLLLDGQTAKPKQTAYAGSCLQLQVELQPQGEWLPQDISLDLVYQDRHLVVINKPDGLVVHPGAGNQDQTLLNGLLFHFPELANVPRAGIVHRLDKDTSGLMVVARTVEAQTELVRQLQSKTVTRRYIALVRGDLARSGSVDLPIARHPQNRIKMAVVSGGKRAVSHYQPLQRFGDFTLVEVRLETGRTHQIRVHMTELGFPLVGDPQYGAKPQYPKHIPGEIRAFSRQALHATELAIRHPHSQETQSWCVPMPADMQQLVMALENNACC